MVLKIRKLCTSRQNAKAKFTKIWRLLVHSALLWNRFDSDTRQFIRQQQSSYNERKVLKSLTQPWYAIHRTFPLQTLHHFTSVWHLHSWFDRFFFDDVRARCVDYILNWFTQTGQNFFKLLWSLMYLNQIYRTKFKLIKSNEKTKLS